MTVELGMIEPTITCPTCSTEIKLTESLAAPLLKAVRQEYEAKIVQKESEVARREAALRVQQKAVADAQKAIDEQVAEKLKAERQAIAAEEAKKARLAAASDLDAKAKELAALNDVLKDRDAKLAVAQKAQAELMKKERELDDAKREFELTVEKKVRESLSEVRKQAQRQAEEGLKLKVTEKEQQISSMQQQIDNLKRKAEQGSQQLQGEVLELELESTLQSQFPFDKIEPVAKGEFGGDVLQHVIGPMGQRCGCILWESKRTKNWTDGWLAKLRDDQRNAKAEVAIIMSRALPKDIDSFGHIDGIWITEPRLALPLALALRQSLIEVANTRQAQEGQETKMELVYQYLTGPQFKHRVEAIAEKITDMQEDLERERKTMTRLWAKREAQIRSVIDSTVGLYGDLQGIAGRALQEIDGFGIPLIESELENEDRQDG